MQAGSPRFIVLSEITLAWALFLAALRQSVVVVGTISYTPLGRHRLTHLAAALRRRGLLKTLADDYAHLSPYQRESDIHRREDLFATSERWLNDYLALPGSEVRFGDYAQAFRHLACNLAMARLLELFHLRGLVQNWPNEISRIVGADAMTRAAYRARFGEPLPGRSTWAFKTAQALLSALIVAAIFLYSQFWLLRHTRFSQPARSRCFLGGDFANDPRDVLLWREVEAKGKQVAVLFRSRSERLKHQVHQTSRLGLDPEMGRLNPMQSLAASVRLTTDLLRLAWRGFRLPGDLLAGLAGLPIKRLRFRALFNLYHFDFLWCRDDYNTDHLLRSLEQRAAGGKSLGLLHGIPVICTVAHQLRYLDFDAYFLFGRDQYDRFYKSTWPAHMKIATSGSFGLSREEFARLRPDENGKDFIVTLGTLFYEDAVLAFIAELAQIFPERKFYVNVKSKMMDSSLGPKLERLFKDGPANIIHHTGRSYDLFFNCRYLLSTGSTLTVEALQCGLFGFVLDIDPRFVSMPFRAYPDICVSSVEQLARRVRSLEDGSWPFPYDRNGALVRMDGRVFWDVVLEEMGLKEGAVVPMPSLAFLSAAKAS